MKNGNRFLIHLLSQEILSCQHSNIRIFLLSFEYGIKQTGYLGAVLVSLFRTEDELAHDIHLGIAFHPVIQQNRVQLSLIQTILSLLLVISSHRQHGRSIARFFFQYFLKNRMCLFLLSVIHIDIPQDSEVTHIIRIFFRQVLYFGKRLFVIIHRQIHTEFLHTDGLGFSVAFLQTVQCIDYLLIIFSAGIKVHQRHQWFQSFGKMADHIFVYINCFCRLPLILIIRSECLIIPIVIGIGCHRILQRLFAFIGLIEEHIEFGNLV